MCEIIEMDIADYSILSKDIFNDVYEPAEDTFILLDALEKDLDLIKRIRYYLRNTISV